MLVAGPRNVLSPESVPRALQVIEYFVALGSLLIEINRLENGTEDPTAAGALLRHLDNVKSKLRMFSPATPPTAGCVPDINLKLTEDSKMFS